GPASAMTLLQILRDKPALREQDLFWRQAGLRVALVPTMGALHAGHLSLVARALALAGRVVVSVFVNPPQFGPNEDFTAYPRNEAEDAARLEEAGAHLLYAPMTDDIYPAGFACQVSVSGLTEPLCGAFRPGHFAGVA